MRRLTSLRLVHGRLVPGLVVAIVALAGCGADDSADTAAGGGSGPARQVDIVAVEYEFRAEEAITIEAGDTIEFRVRNEGELIHQLEVWTDENKVLGRTERIQPGARRDVTVTFDEPGVYQVICDVDDHLSRGQRARFEVVDPA